ncbi:hypothetical protein [Pleurocapsa sp. PCC 7319]|uniref:hypothetical protein n=1 Tax=Pleurocapsa sp. PCC 7319 TaxID=118161 RepID=UPI000346837F|nr:hypothetical protein [Pleurocapsa sp. PCC 7319]
MSTDIAKQLGYEDAIDGLGGESSILEVFLVGNTVKKEQRVKFYNSLYNSLVGQMKEDNQANSEVQNYSPLKPYLDELKNDIDRPPFERIFRSRGLKPDCIQPHNYEKLKQQEENRELKCKQWEWKKDTKIPLVDITANFERKVLLEFAFYYADFIENPNNFDPQELKRTADNLNKLLQTTSDLLQKDIEDLFIKPTLAMIQQEVGDNKGVDFAQVGRSTISTLDGVETQISTSSTSGFQIPQSQDLGELLARAEELQKLIGGFIPTETSPGASEASEIVKVAPLPSSQVIALAVAALEQKSTPVEIETGTSLSFTPGISRSLNSAELNINLTVADPTIKPTAEENVLSISRIGKQELHTTVYTQALDFFDLSTFTSQATLDGGRTPIPIIGNIWNAIFGAIPVFGDLFSISNGNQNVLHESLILTNSFITPTPLSLGNLYSPNDAMPPFKEEGFCTQVVNLNEYFNSLSPSQSIAGKPSFPITKNIEARCPDIFTIEKDLNLEYKSSN